MWSLNTVMLTLQHYVAHAVTAGVWCESQLKDKRSLGAFKLNLRVAFCMFAWQLFRYSQIWFDLVTFNIRLFCLRVVQMSLSGWSLNGMESNFEVVTFLQKDWGQMSSGNILIKCNLFCLFVFAFNLRILTLKLKLGIDPFFLQNYDEGKSFLSKITWRQAAIRPLPPDAFCFGLNWIHLIS